MLTKQHYMEIANIINNPSISASEYHDGCMGNSKILFTEKLIENLSTYFQKDNINFNKDKFMKACKIRKG